MSHRVGNVGRFDEGTRGVADNYGGRELAGLIIATGGGAQIGNATIELHVHLHFPDRLDVSRGFASPEEAATIIALIARALSGRLEGGT